MNIVIMKQVTAVLKLPKMEKRVKLRADAAFAEGPNIHTRIDN
jgi:hypothetical protein